MFLSTHRLSLPAVSQPLLVAQPVPCVHLEKPSGPEMASVRPRSCMSSAGMEAELVLVQPIVTRLLLLQEGEHFKHQDPSLQERRKRTVWGCRRSREVPRGMITEDHRYS